MALTRIGIGGLWRLSHFMGSGFRKHTMRDEHIGARDGFVIEWELRFRSINAYEN